MEHRANNAAKGIGVRTRLCDDSTRLLRVAYVPAGPEIRSDGVLSPLQRPTMATKGGDDLARVGRWMSADEHAAMVNTGHVQVGSGGTTHVAYPASPGAYGAQAKPGSLYVEFDVPQSSLYPAGRSDWAQIPSPDHVLGRLAARRGTPVQLPVPACNIVVVGSC